MATITISLMKRAPRGGDLKRILLRVLIIKTPIDLLKSVSMSEILHGGWQYTLIVDSIS